jgi:NADH dehydrogenase/NADH:ubiquinone oxidoreductase subunit G
MSEILLQIDGIEVKAKEGTTLFDAAQSVGIGIPTLCYRDNLKPYGACRVCVVEIESGGRSRLVAACVYPVESSLVVRTDSEKVNKARKMILEELLAHAPDSTELQYLAEVYGADKDRFEKEPSFCVLCGLCVRYCDEIKKKNAVGFSDRGPRREITFVPEVAARECWDCKECFSLCPTSYAQAAYVLTEALAFPDSKS